MDDTSSSDQPARASQESSPVHVVLVDDEKEERRVFGKLLTMCGFFVTAVAGAEEALARCLHSPPDLILADWCLDKGNTGLDLLKLLRTQEATKDIPFIMMSGVKRGIEAEAAVRRHGGALFMTKREVQETALRSFKRHAQAMVLARRQQIGQPTVDAPSHQATSGAAGGILVIGGDPEIHRLVCFALEPRHGPVLCCGCGRDGFLQALDLKPDLVLLDLAWPGMDGVKTCDLFRGHERTKDVPILVIGAKHDENDLLKSAMERAGANAFLRKPFGENELLRQVSQVLRETQRSVREGLSIGPVTIEFGAKKAVVNGADARLTGMEFDLLACVMRASPRVVAWKDLERFVWGWDESRLSNKEPSTVHVILHRLRGKLGKAAYCLRVHRGAGLQFRPL